MLTAIILILILFLLVFIAGIFDLFYVTVVLLIFINIVFILFLIFLIIEVCQVIFQGKVPYLPSSNKLVKRVLKEIEFREGSVVYDLGSGDGKVLRLIQKKYNVKAIGYEKFFLPFIISWVNNVFTFKKSKFYWKNFYKANLANADYVFCYLLEREQKRLVEKFNKELRPGTIVIANTFKIPGWQEEKEVILKNKLGGKFYIYRK